MKKLLFYLLAPASYDTIEYILMFMRIGIGILTIGHGVPKIMGGIQHWRELGTTFMFPLGIHFLPVTWGFLGAATEFFGGIALVLGLATRIASFCLIIMMLIAFLWHFKKGDSFNLYSFPLTLIVIYLGYLIIGSGKFSLDYYLFKQQF